MPEKNGFPVVLLAVFFLSLSACGPKKEIASGELFVSAIPSSVRLDPVTGKIIEDRPDLYKMESLGSLLESNWVYENDTVRLYAARGEYVSFQLVLGTAEKNTLKDLFVEMPAFSLSGNVLEVKPELFLEWSVEVKTRSFGYTRSSYGPGWYPDALIPLECLAIDQSKPGRADYPLTLPDFRNRLDNQRYQIIWVDQFVPFEREKAGPGIYRSEITVRTGKDSKKIPVLLKVWDFAIPNRNSLAGNLHHEGFLANQDEKSELAIYQLLKRNRVVPVDPNYRPAVNISPSGKVAFDWTAYDQSLKKYFTGEAFTAKYGYSGPGYGEPLEIYLLPFNCYSDHKGRVRRGWPDVATQENERQPEKRAVYVDAIRQYREHILSMVDTSRTRLVVFLNGLDESYYPEAWDRMVYYGKMFKEYFPEARHRVDGGYSKEAMEVIHGAINYWCCHTVGYNFETVKAYRELGVTDWIYGPVLYEGENNSGVGSSTFIDLELTNERVISWATWKYRALTWCSWGIGSGWMAAWHDPETWKLASREKDGPLKGYIYNGNALEVYPPGIIPSVNVPCPTVRLKNMRDGVEEYEFLKLLSELEGSRQKADQVADRIIYLPFGEQSIGNLDVWNHNPAEWDAARIELGALVESKATGK